MAWLALIIAGVFEWGWPVGLKLGWTNGGAHGGWLTFAVVSMAASGALLLYAQRTIPMGTAYAVWTGIGAIGVAILGMLLFGESTELLRILCLFLIITGIAGLKVLS